MAETGPKTTLTPSDVASLLGVSERSIERWVKKEAFPPPLRVGSSRRWLASDIQSWLGSTKRKEANDERF